MCACLGNFQVVMCTELHCVGGVFKKWLSSLKKVMLEGVGDILGCGPFGPIRSFHLVGVELGSMWAPDEDGH